MTSCIYRAKDIINLTSRIDGRLFSYIDNRDFVEVTNYDILNDKKNEVCFSCIKTGFAMGSRRCRRPHSVLFLSS